MVKGPGDYIIDEHLLSPEQVAEKFETSVHAGLDAATAEDRLQRNGPNKLQPPKDAPEWLKLLKHFSNLLLILLIGAAILTYIAYIIEGDTINLILASALVLVVLVSGFLNYMNERSASNLVKSLGGMLPQRCMVIRNGVEQSVWAEKLVVGDLVMLTIGERVPADIRVIYSNDLKVENSSLTGESELISVTVDAQDDEVVEAGNVVFMTSNVMNSSGKGIVIRTGDDTYIGKIASLAGKTSDQQSTMQKEVQGFVVFVAIAAILCALVFFVIGVARGRDVLDSFVTGFILVIVANVPQGLPATVVSLLSLAAERMKNKNVLIKKIDIIESLGSATVIASDKTGTLTQNKMQVQNVWVNCHLHAANTQRATNVNIQRRSFVRPSLDKPSLYKLSATVPSLHNISLSNIPESSNIVGKQIQSFSTHSLPRLQTPISLKRYSMDAKALTPKDLFVEIPLQEVIYLTPPSATDLPGAMAIGRVSIFKKQSDVFVPTKQCIEGTQESASPQPGVSASDSPEWSQQSALMKLVTIASVCNKANFTKRENEVLGGNATDQGLLRYCDMLFPVDVMRGHYPVLFDIPFNSANKWAYTISLCHGIQSKHLCMMKGAPEYVIKHCSYFFQNGEEKEMCDQFCQQMLRSCERCGMMGERVIGFAYKLIPSRDAHLYKCAENEAPKEGLVFMGVLSLADPPREGVRESVLSCRSAGIRVIMVTGDHPLTAEAIARKVGIITYPTPTEVAAEQGVEQNQISYQHARVDALVITGSQIAEMSSEEEWDRILEKKELVFARTTPQQKLLIVQNLQRRGEIVAVTGDGVNDAPALKRANIGVAMGSPEASDVARESADVILMDDQFPSLVVAIEEGRVLFDNLNKTIAYTLAHIFPEVFPIFLNFAFGFPLGLTGLIILSIDLLTEQGPAISLSYEKPESDVMSRPPRNTKTDRLVSGPLLRYSYLYTGVLEGVLCFIAYLSVFAYNNVPLSLLYNSEKNKRFLQTHSDAFTYDGVFYSEDAQQDLVRQSVAAWFITLIMCQFWHIWMTKTRCVSIFQHGIFDNRVTFYGVIIEVCILVIIVYVPDVQNVFGAASPPWVAWVVNFGFLMFIVPLTELVKLLARRNPDGFYAKHVVY